MLENSYLCGSNNNRFNNFRPLDLVVICLKIPTFVVATTTYSNPLELVSSVVICLKIPTFVVATTTIYLHYETRYKVVICLKIPTFVVATTTVIKIGYACFSCDLLENSYLCGSNNNIRSKQARPMGVVICLKIPTFVVATTTHGDGNALGYRCDLLENSYLCGSNNNFHSMSIRLLQVVICLKIPTFVVATTTHQFSPNYPSSVVICLKIPTFVVATTTFVMKYADSGQVVICLKIPTFVVATTTASV